MNDTVWTHTPNKADRSTTMIKNHVVSVFRVTSTHYALYIDGTRACVGNKLVSKNKNKQQLMGKGIDITSSMPTRLLPYPERLPTSHVKSTNATGILLNKILR